MKILIVTTIGLTSIFFKELIADLVNEGHTVDFACNDSEYKVDEQCINLGCNVYSIGFSRFPFSYQNIKAIKKLKNLVTENRYDIVHCHTPVAGACTRIACKSLRKDGIKVFYTAHGFHFYKSAPLINWLIYYPVEKICAHFTDVLITINQEDYALARRRIKAKRVEYIPGVGIDTKKFSDCSVDRRGKRRELGITEDEFLLISVGELNKNKNHQVVIKALAQLNDPNVHYMIAGRGPEEETLRILSQELGVNNQVHLLGYREDIPELFHSADVNIFPSIREGFGLAAIEGLAAGLPLICSDNRGTREYAVDGVNAVVCRKQTPEEYKKAIETVITHTFTDVAKSISLFSRDCINAKIIGFYHSVSRTDFQS